MVDGLCRHNGVASLLSLSLCCFHLLLVALVAGSLDALGAVTNIIFDIEALSVVFALFRNHGSSLTTLLNRYGSRDVSASCSSFCEHDSFVCDDVVML